MAHLTDDQADVGFEVPDHGSDPGGGGKAIGIGDENDIPMAVLDSPLQSSLFCPQVIIAIVGVEQL
jgi:hypothetical protein